MSQTLRVLHLEDNPGYSDLVHSKLAAEGINVELVRVETREDFQAALEQGGFDLIIADYFLPTYDGLKALILAKEKVPEVPILLVSGTIGEEAAIESLKAGATDYVLKHWPERLVPAVRRALREAEERKNRVQAETTLFRREKHFRAISENSLDIVSLLDKDGTFTYNSPSLERVIGYQPGDLIGSNAFALVHPDDLIRVQNQFRNCIANPQLTTTSKFRVHHHDGTWRYLESICKSFLDDPEVAGVVVNSRDVSERHAVEEALRESERRFRQLFEDSPDAIFVEDVNGNVLDANLAAARLQGIPREKLIGMNVADLVPPRQREEVLARFQKLTQGGLRQVEGVTLTSDGRELPVEVMTSLIDYSGNPALLLHVRDISERKQAEEALKGSEIRFHSVWENSVDGMQLTDENGTIVAVNDAFCKLVGMNREELEDKPFTVTDAQDADAERKLTLYRQHFQERTTERHIERKLTFRNGKTVEVEGANSFVESRGQRPLLLGLFRDVTENKRLERELRQSQKMEAIGQLAGGVAHDFNNILTVIQGHASLLRISVGNQSTLGVSADQISQAAERAAGLTRQLLTFSRRQMMQPKQLDLNLIVSNMTKMLARILGEDISLQFNYAPNLPLVNADAGMIEQVLLNLAVNSRDAMPSGGQLTIKILPVNLNAKTAKEHSEGRAGAFLRLSVSDTGSGIDAKTLPHIFEPFFTTKEVGKGTGLGLATVYGIVKQHQGWMEVESQVGRGTTFHAFLPSLSETSPATAEETALEEKPAGGTETILVVEDEPPVRELVCRVLKSCGYQVLQANTGVEALKIWQAHKDRIDLLLTDIVMPEGMTGRDLAEKLQAEKPGLKAIFTSGYSADIVGKDFIMQEGVNYLQKPYVPHKLTRAVRKCLDGN